MQYIKDKIAKLNDLNTKIDNLRVMGTIPAVLMESDGQTEKLSFKKGKLVLVGLEKDCIHSIYNYGTIVLSKQGYEDWGEFVPCAKYYFVKVNSDIIDKIIRDCL